MNCLRAINICWWKHAIVVWVTSYTSEELWLNDAVQWDKGATWSFCWKMNLDGSFLIISQLASKSYGLACWTLSKLLPRFSAKSVPTEKLPFAKERPSTSWVMTHNTCQLCKILETIFVKIVSDIHWFFRTSLLRLVIDLMPHNTCQLCMILENVWHQSTRPPVII